MRRWNRPTNDYKNSLGIENGRKRIYFSTVLYVIERIASCKKEKVKLVGNFSNFFQLRISDEAKSFGLQKIYCFFDPAEPIIVMSLEIIWNVGLGYEYFLKKTVYF